MARAMVHDFDYGYANGRDHCCGYGCGCDGGERLIVNVSASCRLTFLASSLSGGTVGLESASASVYVHDCCGYGSLLKLAERMSRPSR